MYVPLGEEEEELTVLELIELLSVVWFNHEHDKVTVQRPFDTDDPTLRQIIRIAKTQGFKVKVELVPIDAEDNDQRKADDLGETGSSLP